MNAPAPDKMGGRTKRFPAIAAIPGGKPEPVSAEQLISEDAAALLFVDQNKDRVRYDHDRKSWFVWNGTIWQQDYTGLAFSWAREVARELGEREQKKAAKEKVGSARYAKGVEELAKRDQRIAVRASAWNRRRDLLGTPGGTVNLRTGELAPSRREDMITMSAGVTPADEEACPRWHQFLQEITGRDTDLQRFFKHWYGYALTGETTEQALAYQYGFGGNGKGRLQSAIQAAWGDYARTAQMGTFLASKFDKGTEDLAALQGARLVFASETNAGRSWDEGRIKQLTGGDIIRARRLYENSIEFEPTFKLTFSGNHAPAIKNLDEAMRRRFQIVPFKHKPARPDPNLDEKLRAELPGILRWAINGAGDWFRSGLFRAESIAEATQEYFDQQDLLGSWIEERCECDPTNEYLMEKSVDLYTDFSSFAALHGEKVGSNTEFNEAMAAKGYKVKQIKALNTKGCRGIQLKQKPSRYDE